jgi:hypothetical protein
MMTATALRFHEKIVLVLMRLLPFLSVDSWIPMWSVLQETQIASTGRYPYILLDRAHLLELRGVKCCGVASFHHDCNQQANMLFL